MAPTATPYQLALHYHTGWDSARGRDRVPDFGANLRAARERAGLTQAELAEAVGDVTANAIARWERNERTPGNPEQLVRVAEILHTTVETLVGRAPAERDEVFLEGLQAAARRLRELATELDAGVAGAPPARVLPPIPAPVEPPGAGHRRPA